MIWIELKEHSPVKVKDDQYEAGEYGVKIVGPSVEGVETTMLFPWHTIRKITHQKDTK